MFYCLLSCNNTQIDESSIFYLNKNNIEILEFKNDSIIRYLLRDSLIENISLSDIKFLSSSKDSLQFKSNDSLIYKKIELNIQDEIDLESSEYWTIRYKGKGQEWYSFLYDVKPNPNYKLYRYYSAVQYQDTIFSSSYSDNGGFRVFDKFNFMFIGKWDNTGGFVSKINEDSLLFIPINSYSKVVNRPNLYLERYNSIVYP